MTDIRHPLTEVFRSLARRFLRTHKLPTHPDMVDALAIELAQAYEDGGCDRADNVHFSKGELLRRVTVGEHIATWLRSPAAQLVAVTGGGNATEARGICNALAAALSPAPDTIDPCCASPRRANAWDQCSNCFAPGRAPPPRRNAMPMQDPPRPLGMGRPNSERPGPHKDIDHVHEYGPKGELDCICGAKP